MTGAIALAEIAHFHRNETVQKTSVTVRKIPGAHGARIGQFYCLNDQLPARMAWLRVPTVRTV
jgi:hypothetical protein